jgi:NAD(P)-dependent dehydrogenase (short-subunit alcohol dehydrogenase family)
MTMADRAVLVTGGNRGIGQALVEEALRSGACVCRYAPALGPGWARHAPEPGCDQC